MNETKPRLPRFQRKHEANQLALKNTDAIACVICGHLAHELMTHLRIDHNLTAQQYKDTYNLPVFSPSQFKKKSELIKGDKNPAKGHGGRLSPFSDKFLKGNDKVAETKKKAKQTLKDNHGHTTTIEYWLKQGYNEDEAKLKLSERQSTFSLEKCIAKHGKEKGIEVWQLRQDNWQKKLKAKPFEEIQRINRLKMSNGCSVSKAETELANTLINHGFNVLTQQCVDKKYGFIYDILFENKIIEYHGDYWHANPNKYNVDFFNKSSEMSAQQIWDKDMLKLETANKNGFDVLTVWENDYKTNKDETIQKCLTFLQQ